MDFKEYLRKEGYLEETMELINGIQVTKGNIKQIEESLETGVIKSKIFPEKTYTWEMAWHEDKSGGRLAYGKKEEWEKEQVGRLKELRAELQDYRQRLEHVYLKYKEISKDPQSMENAVKNLCNFGKGKNYTI